MSKKFRKSIIGNTYTWLTVEDFVPSPDYESWWKCRCKCGRAIIAHREELIGKQIKSCGCARKIDILYKTFGRLFVVAFSHSDVNKSYWKCLCTCGKFLITSGHSLRNGQTKSCGCYRLDQLVKAVTFHGFSSKNCTKDQIRFSNIWDNMKQRCFNPKNDSYPDYGGRGITVCSRWLEFKNFIEDLWESYLKHVSEFGVANTTLGRQDVDSNYELDNVKWETLAEQGKGQRCSIKSKDRKLHKIWRSRLQGEVYNMLFKAHKLNIYHPNIGCTVGELRDHIAKQFIDGMTWNNHGIYTKGNTKVWHIDHIIPCYKFDLTKQENRLVCFNVKNLRPWWAIDNFSKIR